jgi:lysophospholipase L1-like esterase
MVAPRGLPGAVISRAFQDLGQQNGRQTPFNLIDQAMPFVRRDATLVTIFTGANEVNAITAALGNGAGGTNPSGYIDQKVNEFAVDYATLLAGVRDRSVSARIVVLNVPNVGALPLLTGASLSQKQAAQRASVGMTRAINALAGVAVVDLMCDARLYQPSNLYSDGFHPNDSGYALLGAEVARATVSPSYPAPRSSCPQMTLF